MKKISLIVLVFAIILIGGGLALHYLDTDTKEKPKEKEVERQSKKSIVEGFETNVEDSLRKQRVYQDIRLIDSTISKQGPYYILNFVAQNIGTETTEHQHLDFTILSNTKKVLGIVECVIPELKVNQREDIYCQSTNKKIFEGFDYKITPASKKIEQ